MVYLQDLLVCCKVFLDKIKYVCQMQIYGSKVIKSETRENYELKLGPYLVKKKLQTCWHSAIKVCSFNHSVQCLLMMETI